MTRHRTLLRLLETSSLSVLEKSKVRMMKVISNNTILPVNFDEFLLCCRVILPPRYFFTFVSLYLFGGKIKTKEVAQLFNLSYERCRQIKMRAYFKVKKYISNVDLLLEEGKRK